MRLGAMLRGGERHLDPHIRWAERRQFVCLKNEVDPIFRHDRVGHAVPRFIFQGLRGGGLGAAQKPPKI
jgi:hypothetical protein